MNYSLLKLVQGLMRPRFELGCSGQITFFGQGLNLVSLDPPNLLEILHFRKTPIFTNLLIGGHGLIKVLNTQKALLKMINFILIYLG